MAGITLAEWLGMLQATTDYYKMVCEAQGYNEAHFLDIDDVAAKYREEWMLEVSRKWQRANLDEDCGVLGEAIPIINAHKPEIKGLLPADKTAALRSVGYAESNVRYLLTQTKASPQMLAQAQELSATLQELKLMLQADPPPSQARGSGRKRALTPRARRRR